LISPWFLPVTFIYIVKAILKLLCSYATFFHTQTLLEDSLSSLCLVNAWVKKR
jgi:hypothetical protein